MMNFLKNLALLPIRILSVLTPAKSFRDNPVIGSVILNGLGLHVFRVILARAVVQLRWWFLAPICPRKLRETFRQNGFMVVENFISTEDLKKIRSEVKNHSGETRQMLQGDTATQRFLLDPGNMEDKPCLKALTESRRLQNLLRYSAAKLTPPLLYIQRIRNSIRETGADPQKNMHADTFHPTMKAWLFLEDVTEAKGPFTYVQGSNRMTWRRLRWEYRRALVAKNQPDGYSEKGSFRATEQDLAEMDLPNPRGLTLEAGTLVIANTNGFHGRGQAASNQSRLEIWAYARPSPFNPLPGLPFKSFSNLQMSVLKAHWRRKDKQAALKKSRASWHLIPAKKMTDFDL